MKTQNTDKRPAENQPHIYLPPEGIDRTLNIIAYAALFFWVVFTAVSYFILPDIIPVHYGLNGLPDSYGRKENILLVAGVGLILFGLLSLLLKYPHLYNYPVKITTGNAPEQYKLAQRLLRLLRITILLLFAGLELLTIESVRGVKQGAGLIMLYIMLAAVFGILVAYIIQANKNTGGKKN